MGGTHPSGFFNSKRKKPPRRREEEAYFYLPAYVSGGIRRFYARPVAYDATRNYSRAYIESRNHKKELNGNARAPQRLPFSFAAL